MKAVDYVKAIGECFGKVKTKADQNDPLKCSETEQLAHISPAEFDAVKALAHRGGRKTCGHERRSGAAAP